MAAAFKLSLNAKFSPSILLISLQKTWFPLLQQTCNISTSRINFLKEIRHNEDGNQITIEGVTIKSERAGKVVKTPTERGKCPLCRLGITHLKHTDTLILSQFINSDGTVIPPFISGLCKQQQIRIIRAVALARKAGLLPKPPGTPIFGDWEKYNTYYKKF